jgi:glutamate dehydrogenase/leucine dehydrogenase
MEKRTEIKIVQKNAVFFEAVVKHKTKSYTKTLTQDNLQSLQIDLDVWLKCGNYELVSAEKVERVSCKLIA